MTRRGFLGLGGFGVAAAAGAAGIMDQYSTTLDTALGTTSKKFAAESTESEPLYEAYKPTVECLNADGTGNSNGLIKKAMLVGRKQAVEGSVLLKNNTDGGKGLPLKEGANVTLFGGRSHVMLMGSGMGTKVTGPCVSLERALGTETKTNFSDSIATGVSMSTKQNDDGTTQIVFSDPTPTISGWNGDEFDIEPAGFNLNSTMIDVYDKVCAEKKFGNNEIGVPNFDPHEPTADELAAANGSYQDSFSQYSDAAIVVLGRPSAESYDYWPHSVAEGTGAEEPLALTTAEKQAVELAKQCSQNVIVIINSSNPMEIRELADDSAISSILSVAFPGAYGALGIADILVGRENPSGALADTYATYNMSAPAMQNMGEYAYSNIKEVGTRSAGIFGDTSSYYIMECEGIYIGYKYYETRYYDCVANQGNATSHAGTYASTGAWSYDAEVTYPFGYGLSYTTFTREIDGTPTLELSTNKNGGPEGWITVNVKVTNTGSVAGSAVAAVYGQAPYTQGGVEKSAIQLLDFAKTGKLEPGASETLPVKCDLQNLASWDSSAENADGTKGSYVLEPGAYYFATGNGVHEALKNMMAVANVGSEGGDAKAAYKLDATEGNLPKATFAKSKNGTQVSNHLEYADWNFFQEGEVTHLSRSDWEGTYPKTYSDMKLTDDQLIKYINGEIYEVKTDDDVSEIKWGQESDVMFRDLAGKKYDDELWTKAVDKMTLEEAVYLATYGGPTIPGVKSLGTYEANCAENMGIGFSPALNAAVDTNSPWHIPSDDPNAAWTGSVLGGAVLLASSFSHNLMYEAGELVGEESLFLGYPLLWGPGLNTHRHAYNGRSGEYYSEDPVLTGFTALDFAMGCEGFGLIVAPKHFAFNDQETHRSGIAPYMTEQKAREGDLRAFQIAFEAAKYDDLENGLDSGMKGCMTSFSKIGPVECTCSTGLITDILKGEWGGRGYFVTDIYDDTDLYASVLASGVTCFDTRGISGFDDGATTIEGTSIFASQKNGIAAGVKTVEGDAHLQKCVKESAHMILYALASSNMVNRYNSTTRVEKQMTWWRGATYGVAAAFAVLAAGSAVAEVRADKKEA